MDHVTLRPFDDGEARAVASWVYEAPYDVYNGDSTRYEDYLTIDDDGYGFYAVTVEPHGIVGFCCFGEQARVPGQTPDDGVVDIGGGVRPDLVSQRVATSVFPAVIAFASNTFEASHLRTAIASFNERSVRLCKAAGFTVVRRFDGPGVEFLELLRPVDLSTAG